MRITGSNPLPPAVPTPAARGAGRKETVAEAPAVPDQEAPAETKAHGLVRAAEHSNRSDVAALRQWINHPELRDGLTVPDLAAEHKGKGFERAVAAYQAVAPAPPPADPVVVTDPVTPDPVVTDPVTPDPVVTDPVTPDPVLTDPVTPDPVVTDPVTPDPVVTDPVTPDPVLTDPVTPDPVLTDPVTPDPVVTDPVVTDPVAADPPVVTDPDPVVSGPEL
jgi:hypothetical protein